MMTEAERERSIIRFRQMMKARAWPEWSTAEAKLRELDATLEQVKQIRQGVDDVILYGAYGTTDADVAWHVQQVLSVMLHQSYEMRTTFEKPANEPYLFRSLIDQAWVVSLRQAVFAEASG